MTTRELLEQPDRRSLTDGLSGDHMNAVQQVPDGMLRDRSGGGPGAVLYAEIDIGIHTEQTTRQR